VRCGALFLGTKKEARFDDWFCGSSRSIPDTVQRMSMRATDEGNEDEEENTVYLSHQPAVSTLNRDHGDESHHDGGVSSHGGDVRGYKPLLHDRNNRSEMMPEFVSDAMGAVSGRWADIVGKVQRTFEVKENLDRLVRILQLTTFGLVLTVFIIILAQHNSGHFSHASTIATMPTYMPTVAPGTTYKYSGMVGKIVGDVPSSYVYQSDKCMRECYRAPLYETMVLASVQASCTGAYAFVGIRNAANDQIEVGTFSGVETILQAATTSITSVLSSSISGSSGSGLYWYSVKDEYGKQATGFSTSASLTFTGIESSTAGTDCLNTMFFTSASNTASSSDFAGFANCERFSNSEESLGALHELVIYDSSC
jgi:hypothetical protein